MKIYIDESGTLGGESDKYFILAAFVQYDWNTASRCLKKIRENYLKKEYKKLSELKYSNTSNEIIRRILSCIVKHDISLYYAAYEKHRNNKNITDISCEITAKLVNGIINDTDLVPDIYIDRYLYGKKRDAFNDTLINLVGECSIEHIDSKTSPEIQIADFIAGALNGYHNHWNEYSEIYYNIIKPKLTRIE